MLNEISIMPKFQAAYVALMEAKSIDEVKLVRDQAQALVAYVKQQGESLEMQNAAAEIKLRCERKAGELLRDMDKATGNQHTVAQSHDETEQTQKLSDLGINKSQSSRWQQVAKIPESEFEKHIAETKAQGQELTTAETLRLANKEKPHVSFNSGNNEWYTPPEFIAAARKVMDIDLDPASSAIANRTIQAGTFYTMDSDGLAQNWQGCVWLNPPYASELIQKFTDKLIQHFVAKEVTEAIVLVNNGTETNWFAKLAQHANAVIFPFSRVRFLNPAGPSGSPLQGQAVLYFGYDVKAKLFIEAFSHLGWGAYIA